MQALGWEIVFSPWLVADSGMAQCIKRYSLLTSSALLPPVYADACIQSFLSWHRRAAYTIIDDLPDSALQLIAQQVTDFRHR